MALTMDSILQWHKNNLDGVFFFLKDIFDLACGIHYGK